MFTKCNMLIWSSYECAFMWCQIMCTVFCAIPWWTKKRQHNEYSSEKKFWSEFIPHYMIQTKKYIGIPPFFHYLSNFCLSCWFHKFSLNSPPHDNNMISQYNNNNVNKFSFISILPSIPLIGISLWSLIDKDKPGKDIYDLCVTSLLYDSFKPTIWIQ